VGSDLQFMLSLFLSSLKFMAVYALSFLIFFKIYGLRGTSEPNQGDDHGLYFIGLH
jgi:hypothetical protein